MKSDSVTLSLPHQQQFHMILQGHILDCLAKIPSDSVDCIMTSPPYWGLRDYKLPPTVWDSYTKCEHEWSSSIIKVQSGGTDHAKVGNMSDDRIYYRNESNFCSKCSAWKGQLGLEPDFRLYVRHLLQVTKELKRVLKPMGCLWLNLGDTYSGSGGNSVKWPQTVERGGERGASRPAGDSVTVKTGISAKSLCFIPQRIALAMIDEQSWILRNQIVWFKPNGMPSSVRDRFSNKWEPLFFFVKNPRYWFDLDAVREPHSSKPWSAKKNRKITSEIKFGETSAFKGGIEYNLAGKNPSDHWKINTKPHSFAHFAVFPDALAEVPIKASCPAEVCSSCGKARERIAQTKTLHKWELPKDHPQYRPRPSYPSEGEDVSMAGFNLHQDSRYRGLSATLGWTSCSCNAGFSPGIVLDPFAGSGTTAVVAKRLQRSSVSIELAEHYIPIIKERMDWEHKTIDKNIEWEEIRI